MEQKNHTAPEAFSSDPYNNGIPSLDAKLENEIISDEASSEPEEVRDDKFDHIMVPPPTLL